MSTLHEQARALVRDLAPGPFQKIAGWGHALPAGEREAIVQVARGFLAGHEAATRTRVVTTVTELDALRVGAILRDRDGLPLWLSPHSGWTAANGTVDIASTLVIEDGAPLTVLYDPEEAR